MTTRLEGTWAAIQWRAWMRWEMIQSRHMRPSLTTSIYLPAMATSLLIGAVAFGGSWYFGMSFQDEWITSIIAWVVGYIVSSVIATFRYCKLERKGMQAARLELESEYPYDAAVLEHPRQARIVLAHQIPD